MHAEVIVVDHGAQCPPHHNLHVSVQYVIPYLLGFDEVFQYDSGADLGQPEAFRADWSQPPGSKSPVALPTSAPF